MRNSGAASRALPAALQPRAVMRLWAAIRLPAAIRLRAAIRQRKAVSLLAAASLLASCGPREAPQGDGPAPSTGIRFLADDPAAGGFARALEPRAFEFPEDHGPHPDYRTEWWYFTGNLFDADGRHFGFEVTLFRIALSPAEPRSPSAWATRQVWMAHFALSDTANERFFAAERLARGALGLAGASASPFRAWVEDWSVAGDLDEGGTARLRAQADGRGVDLQLTALKPPVAQGDRGLDPKGPETGNASYYYSIPRFEVRGTVRTAGPPAEVQGLAWMDREWSTSALSANVAGWDWFALQLEDGRDLMYYRLRRDDGVTTPYSGGTLIARDGTGTRLGPEEVELTVLRHWRSRATGVRYPVAWRLRVPGHGLDLEVRPYFDDQELRLSVRYWEGAVEAAGTTGGQPIRGRGYLELAGY